ncbi:hypothetical protein [Neolewinella agarilytica]|uniref:Lipocalin-like domain-containing protein n=1 Tax=Neolewinella agarilytica TaxID=478744 RepID=A0A1H9G8F5_9BACT|nr:hypothetical protein [Neolewinella agarilytica]SEQ46396.1 hypothetical protein SAMN05444359_11083 [Neolewinella agarilytica]
MRNLSLLMLPLCLLLFTACGGDDDSDAVELTQENVVGDWNLIELNNDFEVSIAGLGDESGSSEIANSTVVVTFAADGTWSSAGQYDITIMSSDTTEMETYDDGIGSGTYSVTNSQLSMTGIDAGDDSDTESPTVFTVRSYVMGSSLELVGNASETIMDPFFGLTVSVDVDTEMVLER